MNRWLQQWVPFLMGTPKRTLVTLGVLCVVLLAFEPGLGKMLVDNLVIALMPLFQLAFVAAIVVLGFKLLFKKSSGSSKSKGK